GRRARKEHLMRYIKMTPQDRDALLAGLAAMPDYLARTFGSLSPADAATRGPAHLFSPVEQAWHLADLEREGFGLRIRRLAAEVDPLLPDFDGDRAARERNYSALSLADGLAAFRRARAENIETLRRVTDVEWPRAGTQEGVGPVALCDLPSMM